MTTRLYKSTDAGAPAHSGTGLGQILTILRACLVTGYGTRTAAGWTNPFLDLPNNTGVFRGQAGTGDLFRVNDNLDFEYSTIQGYASMSDVDTGTEEYPIIGNDVVAWKCVNRDASDVLYDAWYVIASEEFCYMIFHSNASYRAVMFFGEYKKNETTSNVPNQIVLGIDYNSTISPSITEYAFISQNNSQRVYQRRNHWDDIQRNTRLRFERNDFIYAQPSPLDGKLQFRVIGLRGEIASPIVYWGEMPDVLSLNNAAVADQFNSIGDILTINGDSYILLKSQTKLLFAFRYDLDVG